MCVFGFVLFCAYIHTYIHVCICGSVRTIHTYIHMSEPYVHTDIHTYVRTAYGRSKFAHRHTIINYLHTYIHAYILSHMQACIQYCFVSEIR
jgi:hypothetical protein